MSTTMTAEAVWSQFSPTLAQLLRDTAQDATFGLELDSDDESGAARYVQFCAFGPGRLRCEVVSNEYLAKSLKHTVDDLRWLAEQGWGEPGDVDGQGSSNHYLDVDVEWADFAADQAIRVFQDLWDVTDVHEIRIDRVVLERFREIADPDDLR